MFIYHAIRLKTDSFYKKVMALWAKLHKNYVMFYLVILYYRINGCKETIAPCSYDVHHLSDIA